MVEIVVAEHDLRRIRTRRRCDAVVRQFVEEDRVALGHQVGDDRQVGQVARNQRKRPPRRRGNFARSSSNIWWVDRSPPTRREASARRRTCPRPRARPPSRPDDRRGPDSRNWRRTRNARCHGTGFQPSACRSGGRRMGCRARPEWPCRPGGSASRRIRRGSCASPRKTTFRLQDEPPLLPRPKPLPSVRPGPLALTGAVTPVSRNGPDCRSANPLGARQNRPRLCRYRTGTEREKASTISCRAAARLGGAG